MPSVHLPPLKHGEDPHSLKSGETYFEHIKILFTNTELRYKSILVNFDYNVMKYTVNLPLPLMGDGIPLLLLSDTLSDPN